MSRPVAAIDCGTNSIRLLVAQPEAGTGRLLDLERHLEMVRLGLGVDRTGRFDPVAVERTLDAARRYARLIEHHGVDPQDIRFVATSATRDASNRDVFIEGIESILGVRPEDLELSDSGRGLPIEVDVVEELGADAYIYGQLPGSEATDKPFIARVDGRTPPKKGEVVHFQPKGDHIHVFNTETGERISD